MKFYSTLEKLILCFSLVNFISTRGIYDDCLCENCENCGNCGSCTNKSKKEFLYLARSPKS